MAVVVEPGAASSVSPSADEMLTYSSTVKKAMDLAAMIGRTCHETSTLPPSVCTAIDSMMDSDELSLEGSDSDFALEENDTAGVTVNIERLNLHESDESGELLSEEEDLTQLLEGGNQAPVNSMVNLMVELAEVMVSLKDTFSKFNRAEQKILVDKTFFLTQPLEEFYALSFNLYECE